jgi:hypothetical protein
VAAAPAASAGDRRDAAVATEARLVADSSFRVQEATAPCLDLLGIKPDALIGKHLLDAVGEGALGDAMLRCLAGLQGAGEARAAVPSRGLLLSISQPSADAPVVVTFLHGSAGGVA